MTSSDDYRQSGKHLVDYVADYLDHVAERQVVPAVTPGYLFNHVPKEPPSKPETYEEVMKDVDNIILPGLFELNSPHFHGMYPVNNSFPAIMADTLASAFNQISISWNTGPAGIELEMMMMDWLARMTKLPEEYMYSSKGKGGGIIQGTASESCLLAIMAAKARAKEDYIKAHPDEHVTDGYLLDKFVMYTSEQAHSMSERTALLTNMTLRVLKVDDQFSLRGPTLEKAIKADLEQSMIPLFVVGSLGVTSCCSFDNLEEIGPICQKYNVWLHIDAAYAGAALICPEFRNYGKGIEYSDSYCFNPFKWMLVTFDCSCYWSKDITHFVNKYNVNPVYLQHEDHGHFPTFNHMEVPLGHRFRALKLWFVIRLYGVEGIQEHIRKQVSLAKRFEEKIRQDARFEISAPPHLGLVCFRLADKDNVANQQLLRNLNARRKIFLSPCMINDVYMLRFVICSRFTEEKHVDYAFDEICQANEHLQVKKSFKDISKQVLKTIQIINNMKCHVIGPDSDPIKSNMFDHAWARDHQLQASTSYEEIEQ